MKMRTTRLDGKATCFDCREASKTISPTDKGCKVEGCGKSHVALGYCSRHYGRLKKHGDPLVTFKGQMHKSQYTPDGLRICKVCEQPKPLSEYHRDKGGTDGYRAQCKSCRGEYMQGWHLENIEQRRAYMLDRRTEMPEHVRALDKARYERDKDKRIALATESVHVRRARMKAAEYDRGITVNALRKIHGDACCYCRTTLDFTPGTRGEIRPDRASLEHVTPISRGGTHTWDNTALACHRCNTSKNAKTLDEWMPEVTHDQHIMVGQQALFPHIYPKTDHGPRQMAVPDQRSRLSRQGHAGRPRHAVG